MTDERALSQHKSKCKFGGIHAHDDGSYSAHCLCGWTFFGPTREEEPDLETRKEFPWEAIIGHFKPLIDEVKKMGPNG